ncbi:hypothetical protein MNBD_GAMMA13-1012 [hydrothermal vent metagenome]|uniref:Rubrerythrin diiron-binding domain-containing protein n=1 Tax=hydrothermal vent metagenome TaxID=652676 RepID=A0A3B0ZJS2_9ZZZZ
MNREFADLSAREVLALAISIEHRNADCYRDWSMRFKTYDLEISNLLNDLAGEEASHESYLTDYYRNRYDDDPFDVGPALVRAGQEIPSIPDDHYFVESSATARAILEAVMSVEVRAHQFYENIIAACNDPELSELYHVLLSFEADHVTLMEKRLSRMALS